MHRRKNGVQPIASTVNPAIGPAMIRPMAKMLEKSAYWVAENCFCVMRSSITPKAPVAIP